MNKIDVSAEKLVETGAHFGHQMRRWNPKMKEFMYKEQDGTFIFDLIKTKSYLENALEMLAEAAKQGKVILFVGTKKQSKEELIKLAKETGNYYISERWLGGTFTNFAQLRRSLAKMEEMETKLKNGEYKGYTKKEKLLINREVEKLNRMIGGLRGIDKIPDVVFIIDTHKEETAVRESRRLNVPVVGIVDSNADPDVIDYPIPMNDDAALAVNYVLDLVKEAISGSKAEKKTEKKAEKKETKKATKKVVKKEEK